MNGEQVSFQMAERGVCLSNGLWVREVRHRDERGHQTAILSTDFMDSLEKVTAALFARCCQENYFRYMMEHYALDRLVEYGAEPLPETSLVVNPQRRKLESQIRRERALWGRERVQLSARAWPAQASAVQVATFEKEQGQLLEDIRQREVNLTQLKEQRRSTPEKSPATASAQGWK